MWIQKSFILTSKSLKNNMFFHYFSPFSLRRPEDSSLGFRDHDFQIRHSRFGMAYSDGRYIYLYIYISHRLNSLPSRSWFSFDWLDFGWKKIKPMLNQPNLVDQPSRITSPRYLYLLHSTFNYLKEDYFEFFEV